MAKNELRLSQHHQKVSFFPAPHPDELLDSIIFRYHQLSGNANLGITLKRLFGAFSGAYPRMLTSRINHLHARLPITLFTSVDDILNKQCVLPAFGRIYDNTTMTQLRKDSYGGMAIGMGIRYRYSGHPLVICDSFRLCPSCVLADTKSFGIAFWHRSHQLNGVLVCYAHGCDLMASCPCCRHTLHKLPNILLPSSFCRNCGKDFFPAYSHSAGVQELANLAHHALRNPIMGTNLLHFAKVVLDATGNDTYSVCQTASHLYGCMYLNAVGTLRPSLHVDWLHNSLSFSSDNKKSGPFLLKFSTFAGVLMTVHILFGSWENLDRVLGP